MIILCQESCWNYLTLYFFVVIFPSCLLPSAALFFGFFSFSFQLFSFWLYKLLLYLKIAVEEGNGFRGFTVLPTGM